ncbi:MAG TPA: ABC transporter ATP-binding protein [Methanosarcinales archaeon]|nr:ABC transporter ATP-binding protein [Methanosarcinales archaeon]
MRLQIKNLAFSYGSTQILKGINMELGSSDVLGIVGPNGAGKSTLIRCIDRILVPQHGTVLLDGQEMKHMSSMEIAKRIGYVPQSISNTFPATVFDTVLMGRRPHLGWRSSEEDIDAVLEVLRILKIKYLAMRDFNEISGGQQQKVLIARALAQDAEILLLDEPTSNLDIRHQLEVMEILTKLVKKKGISVMMAIHDLNLASRYSDRIIMLNGGSVRDAGDPVSVLTAENIQSVYGVEVIVKREADKPYIIPIRSFGD